MGDQLWIYGTRGSLNITLEGAMFYYEPENAVTASAKADAGSKGITTGASYRAGSEMPYYGQGKPIDVPLTEDPTETAVRSFIDCIRTGQEPIADVQSGARVAMAVITANQALSARRDLDIPLVVAMENKA